MTALDSVSTPPRTPAVERTAALRVCHLGKFYPPARGGIETHVQGLARAQAALGAEVTVLCVNHADAAGQDVSWRALARTRTVHEMDGNVEVVRLGRQGNVARLDLSARLLLALQDVIADGCDVLHLQVPNPTFLLALALPALRRPRLVITHHSDIVRQRVLRHVLRPIEEVVYRRASAVIATSPLYLDESSILQAHASKVRVIPLGIDPSLWANPPRAEVMADMRRRIEARGGEPIWLSVGRLVYYKGLATAVQALAHVPGRWVVVGTGPDGPALQELARRTGVDDRITWLGEVDQAQLAAAYHLATALWFPSDARSEAFGLVQVEAMAAGCPVLNCAIRGSGVSWVAPDGHGAITVPIGDPATFAAAARRLLETPGLRDRLSEAARRRSAAFQLEEVARKTLDLYQDVLST